MVREQEEAATADWSGTKTVLSSKFSSTYGTDELLIYLIYGFVMHFLWKHCLSSTSVLRGMSLEEWHPDLTCRMQHLFESKGTHATPRYTLCNVVREWWGTVLPTEKKLSVPSQANNNKPGAGFQWAFSLKWDTATRITNISLVLSSGPGPWKNYSKYLPRFIWNPGIG